MGVAEKEDGNQDGKHLLWVREEQQGGRSGGALKESSALIFLSPGLGC